MITIAQTRRLGREALSGAGVDTPSLDADLLLCHVLRWPRAKLLAHPERPLAPAEESAYRSLLRRREAREPLAYILGRKEFYGLEFAVDRRVLVPRPETELLVELALEHLAKNPRARLAVDVGTGSGAVAVALAVHAPQLRVVACDISPDALSLGRSNALRNGAKVDFVASDLLAPMVGPFDIILANLPYVARSEWATLPPEVRDYEPASALDGGPDGLDAYRRFLPQAAARLARGGLLAVEIGAGQADAMVPMVEGWFPDAEVLLHLDLAGLPRVVSATTA